MDSLQLTQAPVSRTAMRIRTPVADVFAAFVNPAITTKFWFTHGSGPLEPGATVEWTWEMYDVSLAITVQLIEQDRRIVIQWPGYGTPTNVAWTFEPLPDGTTFVTVVESGFQGDGDTLVRHVAASTEGFSLVLAGL